MRGIRLPSFHGKHDCADGRDKVVAVVTDDECALERLRTLNSLPDDKYTSVSVILEECNRSLIDQNSQVLKLGTYTKKMHLQPLCSNVPPAGVRPSRLSQGAELRIPPLSYEELVQMHGPLPKGIQPSRPHNGTIYPWEYASKPPYTSPGYAAPGVKQPIGVVRLPKIPAAPSMGLVGEERMKVPTWVSPLYKPYGVGGPYGPNGPFYRIPSDSCQMPVKVTFWKQPITYIRHAIQEKPKCKLGVRVKHPHLKMPAFPKFYYRFIRRKKPAKKPEDGKVEKPEGETAEDAQKKSVEETKEGGEPAKEPGEKIEANPPTAEAPKAQKPEDVKQPEPKQSEVKQPEVKQPEVKQSEVKQSDVKQPEVKTPEEAKPVTHESVVG